MRLSLVPQERRFYALFKKQGELVNESLEQLRNGLLEGQTRHPRLRELEHECDDVTHEIYNLITKSAARRGERMAKAGRKLKDPVANRRVLKNLAQHGLAFNSRETRGTGSR